MTKRSYPHLPQLGIITHNNAHKSRHRNICNVKQNNEKSRVNKMGLGKMLYVCVHICMYVVVSKSENFI